MKWIKASDRQPEDWAGKIYRNIHTLEVSQQYKSHWWSLDIIEWLDETDADLDAIISEVEDMHPYKQSGNRDSYSKYNEGWADACDILGNRIREALGLPKSEQSTLSPNEYIENLIRQAGGTWKDVDVQKYLDMVKGREEND